jgi:hypothetical protein
MSLALLGDLGPFPYRIGGMRAMVERSSPLGWLLHAIGIALARSFPIGTPE